MATYNNHFISFAIALILLPTICMATEYTVGDKKGWTINFDYQAWAKGKEFRVGDTLGMYTTDRFNFSLCACKLFSVRLEERFVS